MITLKSFTRVAVIAIATVASGLLISGVWVWYSALQTQQDMTLMPTDLDPTVRVFLNRQMPAPPSGELADEVDSTQLLLLNYAIVNFRDGAVRAAKAQAMAELPQVAPPALQDLLEGEISSEFPYIWSYVLAGSFVVMGNSLGEYPIVGFYNPYFDVVLLTKWRFMDDTETNEIGYKLVHAVPVTGLAFLEDRSSLATDQPIWNDSKAPFEVRIVNAAQDFVTSFEERYPPFGRESVVQLPDAAAARIASSVVENRAFYLLQWVRDAQNPNAPVNYAAAIKQLRGALSAASPDELEALLPEDNPQSAGMFFQFGPDVRAGMKPYLVVEKNVIFIDPINLPTAFISVYFEPADEDYVPELVMLFNLAASYPGG